MFNYISSLYAQPIGQATKYSFSTSFIDVYFSCKKYTNVRRTYCAAATRGRAFTLIFINGKGFVDNERTKITDPFPTSLSVY